MNTENFEESDDKLKELRPLVREKALELAAEYRKKGIEAVEALKRAIIEAEEWFTEMEG